LRTGGRRRSVPDGTRVPADNNQATTKTITTGRHVAKTAAGEKQMPMSADERYN
jgi:hypothetical protein